MSKYRKKFSPTKDGFQEVWDSMQDPTIEQVMAGVQAHKPTKEQLLEKIKYFRNSRSTIDIELNRLANYSEDYNKLLTIANDAIILKALVPEGCQSPQKWFNELCDIKLKVEEKKIGKENNGEEIDITTDKKRIKEAFDTKDKFGFVFYVLKNYEPNGLKEEHKFKDVEELKHNCEVNSKRFWKNIVKYYDPNRYEGTTREAKVKKKKMEEIAMKINKLIEGTILATELYL